MTQIHHAACALTLASALSACGVETASVTWVKAPPHPIQARPPEQVDLFLSGPPPRPHVEVALIEVAEVTGSGTSRVSELVAQLRASAGEQGCDAIEIKGRVNEGVGVDILVNAYAADRQGMLGVCFMYTDVAGRAATAPPATQPVATLPR